MSEITYRDVADDDFSIWEKRKRSFIGRILFSSSMSRTYTSPYGIEYEMTIAYSDKEIENGRSHPFAVLVFADNCKSLGESSLSNPYGDSHTTIEGAVMSAYQLIAKHHNSLTPTVEDEYVQKANRVALYEGENLNVWG